MKHIAIYTLLGSLEAFCCLVTIVAILTRKQWRDFWALGSWLVIRGFSELVMIFIFRGAGRMFEAHAAYHFYFFFYWETYAIESVLNLIVIYSLFQLAMSPLPGLKTLGNVVFRWAATISVAVALGCAVTPHMTRDKYLIAAISQFQRTQSILTLCLLIFVTFAIRPMGLSAKSRIFGVSFGLGIMAATDLVQSSWLATKASMYVNYDLLNALAIYSALVTWAVYFALPEPKRRMIILPTTSPFLRWNQISLALGDEPGFVAVAGVPPELLASAEIEMMHRMSAKMVTPFPKSMRA